MDTTFTIMSLSSDLEYTFLSDVDKKEALITVYLMEYGLSNDLREKLRTKIIKGKRTYGLGDFAVLI